MTLQPAWPRKALICILCNSAEENSQHSDKYMGYLELVKKNFSLILVMAECLTILCHVLVLIAQSVHIL